MAVPKTKLREIAHHLKQAKKVSFIIGAGASINAGIPTALGLIKLINEKHAHCLSSLSTKDQSDYGKTMSCLSPAERETLITPLLEQAKINWGQIALAAIIQNEDINLARVLTFNFDLILEKASTLLGLQLPVYDFGVAPSKHVSRLTSPSIVHLHGQSYGLVLLNTQEETDLHKEALRPLLRDAVTDHVTVVIGYSGEADGAFEVIQSEFTSHNRLFWLGYDETPKPHLTPLLNKHYAEYVGNCDFDLTMIYLASELGVWPPEIVKNPLTHLLNEFAPVADYPVEKETDLDILDETRKRLSKAEGQWTENSSEKDEIYQALMDNTISEERLRVIAENTEALPPKTLTALAWSFLHLGNALYAEGIELTDDLAITQFAKAEEKYAEAVRIKPDMHEAYNNWGASLQNKARLLSGNEAIATFTQSEQKYVEAVRIKPDKHDAFNNWGVSTANKAELLSGDEALAAFTQAEQKYAEAVRIKPDKHDAFNNWGIALVKKARLLSDDEAIATLTQAEQKYAEAIRIKPNKYDAFVNCVTAILERYRLYPASSSEAGKILDKAEKMAIQATLLSGTGVYNFACVLAVCNRVDEAVAELKRCYKDKTLPSLDHLDTDKDLNTLRNNPLYIKFRESLN